MPRGRPRRTQDSDEEWPENEPGTQPSQASRTQAEKAIQRLSPDERQRKVNEIVQFMLIADQRKYPIKRTEVNKHVLKEHSGTFSMLIDSVRAQLREVFGMKLIELTSRKGSYIIANELPAGVHLEWSDKIHTKNGLLLVILSLIFMKGNVLAEGILWQFLHRLDVDVSRKHHPIFEDVRKLITQEFTRQLYLNYERIPSTDPAQYQFTWGERAEHEISREQILNFVCEVYGDGLTPEQWTSQYADIQQLQQEGAGGNQ